MYAQKANYVRKIREITHAHTYTQKYSNWTAVIKFMRWDITNSDNQILNIKAV